jgi:hypothetical protein
MKKWLSCLLILFLLAGSFALAESPAAPQKNLIILYTSDVHCAIAKGWGYAGVKAMKTALEQEYDVLLVDDGDHYQGEAAGTLTSGEAILTVMNSMGYDVAIPGNHDFDYGVDHLLELVSKANFPYICCNFFRDGIQVFTSYLVKEIGGRKIVFKPENSQGLLDWGRGVWTYDNTWYWSAAMGTVGDHRFGFNLGYGFGDTSAASENMLFVDGVCHKLNGVTFNIPRTPDGKDDFLRPWKFTSDDGRFEADFVPQLDRAALTDLKVLVSDQHQIFGTFTGKCILDDGSSLHFKNLCGFAEKVHNKW